MTQEHAPEPITIAIKIDNPVLADRLTSLLADVPGLRLAPMGEAADVAVVLPDTAQVSSGLESGLTPRELDVLSLIAEGASNKTIARRLEISIHTAKFHVGSLLEKLEATGRTDALTHAVRLGLIQL